MTQPSKFTSLDHCFQNMPFGLAFFDREYRFLKANPAFNQMTRLSLDEHFGKKLSDIPGEFTQKLLPRLSTVLATGCPLMDVELGSTLASFFPIKDDSQTLIGGGIALMNIKQALRDRDELLFKISHDLRAPLSAVELHASVIFNSLEAQSRSEAIRESARMIHRSISQMARLLNDLLEVRKIEAGQLPLKFAKTPLTPLINDAILTSRHKADAKGIHLSAEIKGDHDVSVDPQRILQVLQNLIDNAIKFTPPNGAVSLRCEIEQNFIEITVSDNGRGIPAEELPHLFNHLRQARMDPEGNGLGLVIAKGIIEAHGGNLWAESVVGHGSRFHISLPLSPEK